MKAKFIQILMFFILLHSLGCDPADNKLNIVNNSDINIYLHYSCDTTLSDLDLLRNGYHYDSLKRDSLYVEESLYLKAHSSKRIIERGYNAWERYLNECDRKIYLFIFSDSIVNKYSNDEIKKRIKYMKRIKVTLNELKENNWTITYPSSSDAVNSSHSSNK